MRQQMQMYLLVGVMVLPKMVKITQNMFKAFLVAIALKGFLFAQGFEIKSFQVSASVSYTHLTLPTNREV